MDKFCRIKISLQEPAKLSADFKARFKKELATNTLYLGIRFSPTNFNRSAAINSLKLAYQCIELFENNITDFGRVICYVKEYPCHNDFMQSIIDADSRTLQNYIQNSDFKYKVVSAPVKETHKIKMWPF